MHCILSRLRALALRALLFLTATVILPIATVYQSAAQPTACEAPCLNPTEWGFRSIICQLNNNCFVTVAAWYRICDNRHEIYFDQISINDPCNGCQTAFTDITDLAQAVTDCIWAEDPLALANTGQQLVVKKPICWDGQIPITTIFGCEDNPCCTRTSVGNYAPGVAFTNGTTVPPGYTCPIGQTGPCTDVCEP